MLRTIAHRKLGMDLFAADSMVQKGIQKKL